MVRKHGWQLPAHTFQVVAITVFCLLVVAFYAFLAPFLWGRIWEYVLISTYSPVAITVFILYVRCTAINPADPGVLFTFSNETTNQVNQNPGLPAKDVAGKFTELGTRVHSSPSTESRGSLTASELNKVASRRGNLETTAQVRSAKKHSSCIGCGSLLCALFVHEDCRKDCADEHEASGEDALFCTLCNVEVRKFSKHCRSCDKCVDGFDHHCRWLNNCVGRKNYVSFISLMATSLLWLIIEAGVGIVVFVRCFANKASMESEIIDRLGNGFSRAPFATVVALCTVVSMLACFPLGELLFFHIILIRKGITTYEFVVAMRSMSEAAGDVEASIDEELPNILYSPSGSTTTGFSAGSSLGHHFKGQGAWCTPPRVFVDYQDEVIPHLEPGMVPSTVDPDSAGAGRAYKFPKKQVRISTRKLAKLDPNEAMKAAAKARASSSVLRPVEGRRLPDTDYSSSGNVSIRSSVSTDIKPEFRINTLRNNPSALSQGSRDEYESGTHSLSSISSPPSHVHESVTLSPLPRTQGSILSRAALAQPSTSKDPLLLSSAPAASITRDVKKTSVVWDQEAGRYVSVAATFLETRNRSSQPVVLPKPTPEISGHGQRQMVQPQQASLSLAKPPAFAAQSDKLTYTGESIFFGGPLLSVPAKNNGARTEVFRPGQHRLVPGLPQDSRFKRDSNSNQLPVFVPGGYGHNPSSASRLS